MKKDCLTCRHEPKHYPARCGLRPGIRSILVDNSNRVMTQIPMSLCFDSRKADREMEECHAWESKGHDHEQ